MGRNGENEAEGRGGGGSKLFAPRAKVRGGVLT